MFGKKEEENKSIGSAQDKFERYQDPTGELPNRELKIARWFLIHKLRMKKIVITILTVWSVLTIGYSFSYFLYYMVVGYTADNQMYANQTVEFQNYDKLRVLYRPQELTVKGVQVFEGATDKYDMVALVANPNDRWIAKVKYYYKFGADKNTDLVESILLPGEQRPLIFFGQPSDNFVSRADLIIDSIVWEKVDPHTIADVGSFVESRKSFSVSDFKFVPANKNENLFSHIVEFDVQNNSSYSFWTTEFYVELVDNGIVGYLYFSEDNFRAGDVRQVAIHSQRNNLNVQNIKVYPIVNVFSGEAYMKPSE